MRAVAEVGAGAYLRSILAVRRHVVVRPHGGGGQHELAAHAGAGVSLGQVGVVRLACGQGGAALGRGASGGAAQNGGRQGHDLSPGKLPAHGAHGLRRVDVRLPRGGEG